MIQHIQRVAHRGGAQLAPENTLAAFHNALTLPVDAIELDVHMSRDGHLVVFHDNVVDKRTNGRFWGVEDVEDSVHADQLKQGTDLWQYTTQLQVSTFGV